MKYFFYFLLLILISCGSQPIKQQNSDLIYQSSGTEQFFLPELPTWANFSQEGQCYRSSSNRYLDFKKIHQVYQLSYLEMVELQAQFNDVLEKYFRSAAVRFLKPVEEASMFTNTLEKVRGEVRLLKIPASVKKVDIIWLESFEIGVLQKMAQDGKFDEGLPILFSSCHNRQSLYQWITANGLDQVGFYLLPSEYLTPFNDSNELKGRLSVELSKILNSGIKINLVSNENKKTYELKIP
jgi:hypothetical protein